MKKITNFVFLFILSAATTMAASSLYQVSSAGWYQPEMSKSMKEKLANK